ncbi:MAG: hypothetical protein K0R17_527 [Rariglobus sp.]|jgi:hypothetical protein|nr:hypothetical protein [Rariglobus sp.]
MNHVSGIWRRLRIRGAIIGCALVMGHSSVVISSAAAAAPDDAFGRSERKGATLIGIFYDLKQTQQREPIPEFARRYCPYLDEFLVSGFDEALLNRFFRAATPLYTTQFAIPNMNANGAPKAFGVEGVVKPSYWVVHYKGQVAPPVDGTYRFVGNFDDLLIVAINRKVILDGSRPDTRFPRLNWKEPADKGPKVAANEIAEYGDWIDLKAGQPVDLDILIGERPGGQFHGVILYEKKGETYPRNERGQAILPLFQIAENQMNNPRFLTDRPVWTCVE